MVIGLQLVKSVEGRNISMATFQPKHHTFLREELLNTTTFTLLNNNFKNVISCQTSEGRRGYATEVDYAGNPHGDVIGDPVHVAIFVVE